MTDKNIPWWGTRTQVSPRLKLEIEKLKQHFDMKSISLVMPEQVTQLLSARSFGHDESSLGFQGTFTLNVEGIEPERLTHTIMVVTHDNYPNHAPDVFCLTQDKFKQKHSPHTYGGGKMCLYNPSEGRNHGWNPGKGTVANSMLWGVQWLYARLFYDERGHWVGEEERVSERIPDEDTVITETIVHDDAFDDAPEAMKNFRQQARRRR